MKSKQTLPRLTKYGYERSSHDDSECPNPDEEIVLLVRLFIRDYCKPHSRFNKHCDSYTMKHIAEKAIGAYVGNGEFIKAARDEGYVVGYSEDYLTCDLRMKCKTGIYSNYYNISDYQKKKEYV